MAESERGIIVENIIKFFGVNWKTSLAGLALVLLKGYTLLPQASNDTKEIANQLIPVIAGLGLVSAKDKGVTGTTK